MYGHGGPSAQDHIQLISEISPYAPRWTIKVRVTSKTDIRTYTNQRGEGKLFACELLDASGRSIKATFFNKGVDQFFEYIIPGSVYTFSGGRKGSNKMTNEDELTFDERSVIQNCPDDANIKSEHYGSFTKIGQIASLPAEAKCDVLGVVTAVNPVQSLRSKAGRDLVKRDITIMDDTLTSISLTLWGDQAEPHNDNYLQGNPVVAVRACRVSEFSGRSLSTTFDSKLAINPTGSSEAAALAQWYSSTGAQSTVETLSVRGGASGAGGTGARDALGLLADINDDNIIAEGMGGAGQYVSVRAWITYLKPNAEKVPWYTACPGQGCNKKVTADQSTGQYWCEKCQRSYDHYEPRYMLSFAIADSSASRFVSAFNEEAASVLGVTARDLEAAMGTDPAALARVFADRQNTLWEFRLRAKPDRGQDDNVAVRAQVFRVTPVDYKKECHTLLNAIQQYC